MDINDICGQIVQGLNTALGCAVVDLNSGLLLGVSHKVPYFTASYLDAAAAAAVDMVRGRTVTTIEQMISNIRGKEDNMMIEEIQITTKSTYHFLAVIPEKPNSMVVLITSRKANLGMGWSAIRMALPKLAPMCP